MIITPKHWVCSRLLDYYQFVVIVVVVVFGWSRDCGWKKEEGSVTW